MVTRVEPSNERLSVETFRYFTVAIHVVLRRALPSSDHRFPLLLTTGTAVGSTWLQTFRVILVVVGWRSFLLFFSFPPRAQPTEGPPSRTLPGPVSGGSRTPQMRMRVFSFPSRSKDAWVIVAGNAHTNAFLLSLLETRRHSFSA